jgi:hypothetical protein
MPVRELHTAVKHHEQNCGSKAADAGRMNNLVFGSSCSFRLGWFSSCVAVDAVAVAAATAAAAIGARVMQCSNSSPASACEKNFPIFSRQSVC